MNGKNRYTCQTCGGQIVTEDRDEGTTPFMIDCKAKVACAGPMQSSFYPHDITEPATFIWRKPTHDELLRIRNPHMLQHFAMGGLGIYPNPQNGGCTSEPR